LQHQQQQQQQQQQQMMMTAAAMTPGIGGVRPMGNMGAMPGLHPGMSPQQQMQQLQIQQQQRSLLTSVRPPQASMPAASAQQMAPPQMSAAGPQLLQGGNVSAAAAAAAAAGRAAVATTPTPTSAPGSAGQRGVKRKSVNSSPALSAQSIKEQQPLTKSPRIMSPASAAKQQPKRPGSAANSSPLANAEDQQKPKINGDTAQKSESDEPSSAPVGAIPVSSSSALAPNQQQGSPAQPPMPQQAQQQAQQNAAPPAISAAAPMLSTSASIMSASAPTASAAQMAMVNNMTPAQRQQLILAHHHQQQQQAQQQQAQQNAAGQMGQANIQQQQQQQQQQQAQMMLVQLVPNFGQLPVQVQTGLIQLVMQQRALQTVVHQYQMALQAPTLNAQQRNAYMMQLTHYQNSLTTLSQQFGLQLAQLKQQQQQQQTTAVVGSALTEPAAASSADGLGFFLKDGTSGAGGGAGLVGETATSQPQPQPQPPEAQAQQQKLAALPTSAAAGGAQQPANTTTNVSAANFRMAPRAQQQPTVVPVDKTDEVLNSEQKATLGRWLDDVARIGRSNDFRMRETALYQESEAQYRLVLEEQRKHNAANAMAMRRERETEQHLLASRPRELWGPGYAKGLGNGRTMLPPSHQHRTVQIVVPGQRAVRPGRQATLRFSRKQLQRQAAQREVLVPIRLDIDADGYRLRDAFTWDLNNELIEPRWFAQGLCLDLDLPAEIFVPVIVQSIEDQLEDYRQYGQAFEPSSDYMHGMLADAVRHQQQEEETAAESVEEATAKMARVELQASTDKDGSDGEALDIRDTAMSEAEAGAVPTDAWVDDELRIAIRIDIVIGHIALRDQIEWDVAPLMRPPLTRALGEEIVARARSGDLDQDLDQDPDTGTVVRASQTEMTAALVRDWVDGALRTQLVSPERVARVVCAEKALGGEFETSIAHAIREQLYAYAKSFLLAGYAYRPQTKSQYRLPTIDDRDLARCILPPLTQSRRDLAGSKTFAPVIVHLHSIDAERLEKDADRESRRKRRQGRGRVGTGAGGAGGGAGGGGGSGAGGGAGASGGGPSSAGLLLPADRDVHRTNRTMIPLPSWFDDALPPDTISYVSQPGEGAHFLDSYDIRAMHEANALALGGGSSAAAVQPLVSADALLADSFAPADHQRALASGAMAAAAAELAAAASIYQPPTPVTPAVHTTPLQQAREKLRNPTGRPRGRPSILEKSLRDASALRTTRVEALGRRNFRKGAVPGQLAGRPLEELVARWRCMSCGVAPDRTPLICRGPEGMHSLCDRCGDVYADSRRFRSVSVDEISANVAYVCGPLTRPTSDAELADPALMLETAAAAAAATSVAEDGQPDQDLLPPSAEAEAEAETKAEAEAGAHVADNDAMSQSSPPLS
ncbi:SWI/SNF chromatin-remodeling complex subunit, partial [Coemansia sp. RSA 1933]